MNRLRRGPANTARLCGVGVNGVAIRGVDKHGVGVHGMGEHVIKTLRNPFTYH